MGSSSTIWGLVLVGQELAPISDMKLSLKAIGQRTIGTI